MARRRELGDRTAILRDHERLADPLELVHEVQALGLEFGGIDPLPRLTMVVTMIMPDTGSD
jgi:hypothetical protein